MDPWKDEKGLWYYHYHLQIQYNRKQKIIKYMKTLLLKRGVMIVKEKTIHQKQNTSEQQYVTIQKWAKPIHQVIKSLEVKMSNNLNNN